MKIQKLIRGFILPVCMFSCMSIQAKELNIKVENLAPQGGIFLTPVWLGFHDGSFDTFDTGMMASTDLEHFAEDGNAEGLRTSFAATASNGLDTMVTNPQGFEGAPVFEPGSSTMISLDLDPSTQKYMSYASMIIPSNDAFIANDDATQYEIFNDAGEFNGPVSFTVYGSMVMDAGTEENNEMEAAFLNQTGPNSGITTNDNIMLHPGFNGSMTNPDAMPVNILGGTVVSGDIIDPVNGDFSMEYYPIMRITVSDNMIPVRVAIKNTSAENGTFLTPFWVAFHDGIFDTYNYGELASPGLERIAEDGDSSVLSEEFTAIANGFDDVITNPEGFADVPLFDPGLSSQKVFHLNPDTNRYFSFVSMLLPSNDAFIANGNPKSIPVFDGNGLFHPAAFTIYGSQVNDAGTEENTEMDAPFFNQSAGNTGNTTSNPVSRHPGFNGSVGNPDGEPQIFLNGTNPPGFYFDPQAADFTVEDATVAQITISRLVDGSMSGTWYNPDRSGEGFMIDITQDEQTGASKAVVTWYTYKADNTGTQSWLIGSNDILGDTVIADMYETEGARFGDNFNSQDIIKKPWGQITLKFIDCENISITYNALDEMSGSGEINLVKLTQGPVDYIGSCQL